MAHRFRQKNIENRSWKTNYRGVFLVHAGVAFSKTPLEDIEARFRVKLPPREEMLRGGIIGSCELVDCVTAHRSKWFEGPYGFVLKNARLRRFERVRGKLGFWDYIRRHRHSCADIPPLSQELSQRPRTR